MKRNRRLTDEWRSGGEETERRAGWNGREETEHRETKWECVEVCNVGDESREPNFIISDRTESESENCLNYWRINVLWCECHVSQT